LINQEKWEEALQTAQAILNRDACWEHAYRILMTAYAQMGNRAQAVRSYHRCVENLQTELGVSPTDATIQLWQNISES